MGVSAVAWAATEGPVRVLLYEGAGPIRLGVTPARSARQVWKKVGIKGAGLEVDGQIAGRVALIESDQPIEWAGKHYRGQIRVQRAGAGILIINELSLDEYVAGSLFRVAYSSWKVEAL
jgi:hypothetical protein